jgi:hypothetical protein
MVNMFSLAICSGVPQNQRVFPTSGINIISSFVRHHVTVDKPFIIYLLCKRNLPSLNKFKSHQDILASHEQLLPRKNNKLIVSDETIIHLALSSNNTSRSLLKVDHHILILKKCGFLYFHLPIGIGDKDPLE